MSLVDEVRAAQLPPTWERRGIREAAGASLRDVAGELGVDPMSVLRWERGETKPRRDRAAAYRKLLDDLRDAAAQASPARAA